MQGASAQPAHCSVGAYVTDLHDLNPDQKTFEADLWLWSVCPNAALHPLDTMEFVNASSTSASLATTMNEDGAVWSSRKISGTFRYNWDLDDFPFDRHTLPIVIEPSELDTRHFVYDPDTANSAISPHIALDGWHLTGLGLMVGTETYRTTFGDPTLPPGSSTTYSQLTIAIPIARTGLTGFVKLTVVAYASFLLALVSYFLELDEPGVLTARMGILAGALFACAISLGTVTGALGSETRLTLIGRIHIAAIVAILVATFIVTISRQLLERGWTPAAIKRMNLRAFAVTGLGFLAANAILIALAVHRG